MPVSVEINGYSVENWCQIDEKKQIKQIKERFWISGSTLTIEWEMGIGDQSGDFVQDTRGRAILGSTP